MSADRVLIVDDMADSRLLFALDLKAQGFDVLHAGDGAQALKIAREQRPDLILLDVMLPDIDGLDVCRRLRADESTRLIPVAMFTVLNDKQLRDESMAAGADACLFKPVERRSLISNVRTLIEAGRLRAAG